LILYFLALDFALLLDRIDAAEQYRLVSELADLPNKVDAVLKANEEKIQLWAEQIAQSEHCFFIGRGVDYPVSLEGALKLKEISYIHAEAYAAGELKHGTIALIAPGTPVIALVTQKALNEKMISNIVELKAREAKVFLVGNSAADSAAQVVDYNLHLPAVDDLLMPILTVVPLQLLAYYAAAARGCDIDQPRNLAKSVTVE